MLLTFEWIALSLSLVLFTLPFLLAPSGLLSEGQSQQRQLPWYPSASSLSPSLLGQNVAQSVERGGGWGHLFWSAAEGLAWSEGRSTAWRVQRISRDAGRGNGARVLLGQKKEHAEDVLEQWGLGDVGKSAGWAAIESTLDLAVFDVLFDGFENVRRTQNVIVANLGTKFKIIFNQQFISLADLESKLETALNGELVRIKVPQRSMKMQKQGISKDSGLSYFISGKLEFSNGIYGEGKTHLEIGDGTNFLVIANEGTIIIYGGIIA